MEREKKEQRQKERVEGVDMEVGKAGKKGKIKPERRGGKGWGWGWAREQKIDREVCVCLQCVAAEVLPAPFHTL